MSRRGYTLIQALVGMVVGTVVGMGVFRAMIVLWRANSFSVSMPAVQDDAKSAVLTLAGALRRATLCTATDTGCTLDAAVESTSATGVTAYRRNADGSLSKLAYTISSGALRLNGAILVPDATIALSFYGGATYHSSSLTSFVPTASTTKTLTAVGITATVARGGLTGTYSTFVRLRNSPKKTYPGE